MPLYLDKQIVANSGNAKAHHSAVMANRKAWQVQEGFHGERFGAAYNAAARLPQDAFREFDRTTKTIMAGDEGSNILNALPVRSLPVGKIVAEYARSSDIGDAQATISGRAAHKLDRVSMDYDGALVLIHDRGFGRMWREVEAMRTEDFDVLQDDQAAAVRAVQRSMANHAILGVPDLTFKGSQAYGMKNSPNTQDLNLGAAGVNVDLTTSTSYADFESAFIAALQALQGKSNNVMGDITFAVSSEIWFQLMRRGTNETQFRTFYEALRGIAGVADIIRTNGDQLEGNEFLAWRNTDEYIQLQSGMAVNTQPVVRQMYNDPFNFVTWGAAGLLIKADAQGRSGVLYAREIS